MRYYRDFRQDLVIILDEEYRDYPFNKNYMVSNYGSVYCKRGYKVCQYIDRNGYLEAKIDNVDKSVHRLVLLTFDFNPNYKTLEVNHKDGVKTNNVLSNLEWCTRSENIIHAFDHNLAKSGEDHPNAIHSNAEVAEICKYIKYDNMNAKQISEALNVEYNTNFRKFVNRIRIGLSWKRIYDSV